MFGSEGGPQPEPGSPNEMGDVPLRRMPSAQPDVRDRYNARAGSVFHGPSRGAVPPKHQSAGGRAVGNADHRLDTPLDSGDVPWRMMPSAQPSARNRRPAGAGRVFHRPSRGAVPQNTGAPVGGRWETRALDSTRLLIRAMFRRGGCRPRTLARATTPRPSKERSPRAVTGGTLSPGHGYAHPVRTCPALPPRDRSPEGLRVRHGDPSSGTAHPAPAARCPRRAVPPPPRCPGTAVRAACSRCRAAR